MGERTLESQTPIRNEKNKHQQLVCYVPDHMADHPCYFSTLTFFASLILVDRFFIPCLQTLSLYFGAVFL